jgi:hypothetical protein
VILWLKIFPVVLRNVINNGSDFCHFGSVFVSAHIIYFCLHCLNRFWETSTYKTEKDMGIMLKWVLMGS